MKFTKLALSLTAALVAGAAAHPASAQTLINSCREFTQPGTYELTMDLSGKSYDGITCFRFKVSNVTLDLGGHTVRGFNGVPQSGVTSNGSVLLGLKVRNGNVSDFTVGVNLEGTFGAVVENLELNVNKDVGLKAGNGAIIQHVKAIQNRNQGVTAGAGSFINDLHLESSGSDGLRVGLGSWVMNSWSEFNAGYGIVLDRTLVGTAYSIFSNTTGANGKGGISADCTGGGPLPSDPGRLALSVVGNTNDPLFPNHGPHIVANVPVVRTFTSTNGTQYVAQYCQVLQTDAVIHKSDDH